MESSMSKRPALDPLMLAQFTGSQNFYRHGLVREVLYTEGVEYVIETAGAYWLLDEIALAQRHIIPVKREDFQVWDLKGCRPDGHTHMRRRQWARSLLKACSVHGFSRAWRQVLLCRLGYPFAQRVLTLYPNAIQRHQDGLTGPVHFCVAIKRRSMPVQWYTLQPLFITAILRLRGLFVRKHRPSSR
jgi:hypothetical protein